MRINHRDDQSDITKYIKAILKSQGRDFSKCELCGAKLKKPVIHHTKYEGATMNDIQIICQSCNLKKENTGLK